MSIRVVHVGVGGRGVWPVHAFTQREDFQSVALVDIRDEALAAAREKTGLSPDRCFYTLEKALEAVETDVVCVITPPHLHASQCMTAVQAGKHVFVEKPFTLSLSEAQEIIAAADDRDVKVCVAQNDRHGALHATLARLVRERVHGAAVSGIMTKFSWRPGVHHSGNVPHSYLWERGIHDLDTLRSIFHSEPVRVFGISFNPAWSPYHHGGGAHALIEFANGAVCTYLCSFVSHGRGSELSVECTEGCLRQVGDGLVVYRAGKSDTEAVTLDPAPSAETQLLDGFRNYLETGEEPSFGGHENLKTLALIEALIRASDGKRVVEL
ncbi:MAG: Gfo/Idh/MocA family oxidoreductase [Armatimonadetes bacterium]|nr:Gfo/Idh/MocA family oxidoreductase [Armatimonadota bacterium]